MKKIVFISVLLLNLSVAIAQNPFSSLGVKNKDVKVLTLSNGKYEEFEKYNRYQRVGSVVMDMQTMKIAYFIDRDTLRSEATLEPEVVSRWLSMDPLAAKYPELSPYQFVSNNPINAIDPDGRLIIFVNGFRPDKSQGEILSNTNTEVFKKDKYNYWEGMDKVFEDIIDDHNSIYADGSEGIASQAESRYQRGREQGMNIIEKIKNGEIVLAKDNAGKIIETIKIVAHSQGCATAAGQAEALIDAGYNVEVIYNIAPKQPSDINTPEGVGRVVQYGSNKDKIAPQSKMKRAENRTFSKSNTKDGWISGHLLSSYNWIFDIKKEKDGGVRKGSDVDLRKSNNDKNVQDSFDKDFKVK